MSVLLNSIIILIGTILISYISYKSLNIDTKKEEKTVIKVNRTITTPSTLPVQNLTTAPQVRINNQIGSISQPQKPTQQQNPSTSSFSTSVNYGVPGSTQSMSVSLTLQNGVIVNISTSHSMRGSTSKKYQERFQNSFRDQVIGKNIRNISLSRIGGATLTTNAFMQAINSIRNSF